MSAALLQALEALLRRVVVSSFDHAAERQAMHESGRGHVAVLDARVCLQDSVVPRP